MVISLESFLIKLFKNFFRISMFWIKLSNLEFEKVLISPEFLLIIKKLNIFWEIKTWSGDIFSLSIVSFVIFSVPVLNNIKNYYYYAITFLSLLLLFVSLN